MSPESAPGARRAVAVAQHDFGVVAQPQLHSPEGERHANGVAFALANPERDVVVTDFPNFQPGNDLDLFAHQNLLMEAKRANSF
jgi:hypothetical protein